MASELWILKYSTSASSVSTPRILDALAPTTMGVTSVSCTHLDVYKRQATTTRGTEPISAAATERGRATPAAIPTGLAARAAPDIRDKNVPASNQDAGTFFTYSLPAGAQPRFRAVSYTHLDVYKRQVFMLNRSVLWFLTISM